ncbi:bifunctional phosphopantothenoylcysteine decarboxylase/phosphopantothenate--cysteine ligase CoaBC [Bacillus horti]|uniref:Coenzyme A biosynthesis bifunctional protein CoaBC n=1 Tax=Caldalkalibacillus horti TaxID=77523 RepID=A0ABT9VXH6_9BACI|nr:bifunctional phosphopantothenoylcysteine decarboxylase/phosphopantothenate--cysteine ligase CoaBC [Bacillus horti]MDQ0165696.1 phosphopantothenoylcysteine decarboxylase/phosphopantothenate--cysteine ligase [Bacillus horti]
MSVKGKMIVLGVSGGIAAYKAATICSQLTQRGADVRVIMTESATKFIQPLTFQTLSRNHVYVDTFQEADASVVSHIDLADHADLFLIAPATANIIGKLANGLADDMLSTTLLATEAPIWMAPAMNGHMLEHPAVQQNITTLKSRGVGLLQPGEGQLACGYVGKGRLPDPEEIIGHVVSYFLQLSNQQKSAEIDTNLSNPNQTAFNQSTSVASDFGSVSSNANISNTLNDDPSTASWWKGKKLLVTAGPTREEIDPVRYLSNYSSGKMGFAIAEMAASLGAQVTLISGPVELATPAQVERVNVVSTEDMLQQVLSRYEETDVVIKSAAVADYTPIHVAEKKIKKAGESLLLELKKTQDILQTLGEQKKHQILVGFAAETNQVEEHARQKLKKKNLDFVVANDVTEEGAGFGTDTNIVTIYHRSGEKQELQKMSKSDVARKLLELVATYYE